MAMKNERGQFLKGHSLGFAKANADWWKGKKRPFSEKKSEEWALYCKIHYGGKHFSPATEFKKGHISTSAFKVGHLPWNTGIERPEKDRAKISEGLKRSYKLGTKIPTGYSGSKKHKQLEMAVAKLFESSDSKVEVEKVIMLNNNHCRVIDVLVDDLLCVEVGRSHGNETKIGRTEELEKYGFSVINVPYSFLHKKSHKHQREEN